VLWSFGREEEVECAQLERLVRSIERFLSPEQAPARQAGKAEAPLRFLESRPLGGGWVLNGLWQDLGIPRAIREGVAERRVRLPVERALFAMVANRALAPASKLATHERLQQEVALPGTEGVELHHLYRAMDLLVEAGEPLQRAIYFSVADLLQLEVDLLFLDTTTRSRPVKWWKIGSPSVLRLTSPASPKRSSVHRRSTPRSAPRRKASPSTPD